MEMPTAEAGERNPTEHHGLPLSSGNQQVEQNRASDVLSYHFELAGSPLRKSGGDREPHCPYGNQQGLDHRRGSQCQLVRERNQSVRRRDVPPEPEASRLSRGVELHDFALQQLLEKRTVTTHETCVARLVQFLS